MTTRFPTLTIRHMLIGVAVAGLLMSLFRLAIWVTNPSAGPLASYLYPSERVVTSSEVTVVVSDESNTGKMLDLAFGTHCLVVQDPASDEDSCYGNYDRTITVKIDQGKDRGVVVTVPRRYLRLKQEWNDLRPWR